jgi:hypothetical protein
VPGSGRRFISSFRMKKQENLRLVKPRDRETSLTAKCPFSNSVTAADDEEIILV